MELFRMRLPSPVFMAPIGAIGLCAQDGHGDLAATARAAARTGVPMVANTLSVEPMEQVAAEFATPRASSSSPRPPTGTSPRASSTVPNRRATAASWSPCHLVTLDTWITGWRPRDLATANFPQLRGHCLATYTSDPVFRALLDGTPEEDSQSAVVAIHLASPRSRPVRGRPVLCRSRRTGPRGKDGQPQVREDRLIPRAHASSVLR
ncbi:alpha-hydroxy-acid oxidizing protein [Streptomyces sviceus]|uniref:alpha-hydroxy-acid oxidizing protein n=1 Tax=Streptomyces sviceus TaxID=285530 RepID=UPI0036EFD3BC